MIFGRKTEERKERDLYLEIAGEINRLNQETADDVRLRTGGTADRIRASLPYAQRMVKVYRRIEELDESDVDVHKWPRETRERGKEGNPLTRLFKDNLVEVERRLGYGIRCGSSSAVARMASIERMRLSPGYILE